MKIVVVAATKMEVQPSLEALERLGIGFCETGVGMLATAVRLTQLLHAQQPDLIIQAGIAGCFKHHLPLGKVMVVNNEQMGDLGVQEQGSWKDVFALGLADGNEPPFKNGTLPNPWLSSYNLQQYDAVDAITVNTISTEASQIEQLQQQYNPTLESMEGAALHYVCTLMNKPFVQLRATSNYVGERNKSNWQIKLAIDNLNEALMQLINGL